MIVLNMAGVIKCFKDNGKLNDLEEISSSSSGALLASLYVLYEGDIDKVVDLILNTDIKKYTQINIKTFLKSFGFIETTKFNDIFDTIGLRHITFRELYYKYPIKLHIATYDILTNKTIYNSIDTSPDMDVSESILRSISVPLLFSPIEGRYIDGSTVEYSPSTPFLGKVDVFELRATMDNRVSPPPKTILQYIMTILRCIFSNRIKHDILPGLDLPIYFNIFDFSMEYEQRLEHYKQGYEVAACRLQQIFDPLHNDRLKHHTDDVQHTSDECSQTPIDVPEDPTPL